MGSVLHGARARARDAIEGLVHSPISREPCSRRVRLGEAPQQYPRLDAKHFCDFEELNYV